MVRRTVAIVYPVLERRFSQHVSSKNRRIRNLVTSISRRQLRWSNYTKRGSRLLPRKISDGPQVHGRLGPVGLGVGLVQTDWTTDTHSNDHPRLGWKTATRFSARILFGARLASSFSYADGRSSPRPHQSRRVSLRCAALRGNGGSDCILRFCHCRICQRSTGAPAPAYASFPIDLFRYVTGTPRALHRRRVGRANSARAAARRSASRLPGLAHCRRKCRSAR